LNKITKLTRPVHTENLQRTFEYSDTVRINYYEIGGGSETIVLLHGFASSAMTWDKIWNDFPERYRVFVLDLKGFGYSSKPDDFSYSPVDQAGIIIKFLEVQRLTDVVLIGHSYGGGIALIASVKLLQFYQHIRIDKFILIGSAGFDRKLPFFIGIARKRPVIGRFILSLTTPKIMMAVSLKRAFFDAAKVTDELIEKYARCYCLPGSKRAMIRAAQQIIPENFEEIHAAIGRIHVPVLIVWGKQDSIIPVKNGYDLKNLIPNSRLEILSECGHMVQEEKPRETITAINNFLDNSLTIE
jgi:pimeloyl-ACP methyl ester carboxylesterase